MSPSVLAAWLNHALSISEGGLDCDCSDYLRRLLQIGILCEGFGGGVAG
jgi:hypothetical protein